MSERRSLFGGLWRVIDGVRRLILNVVFFGFLLILIVVALSNRPKVPGGAALGLPARL